jgi:hypothetical protein
MDGFELIFYFPIEEEMRRHGFLFLTWKKQVLADSCPKISYNPSYDEATLA